MPYYNDGYVNKAAAKQHFKLSSWKSSATLRLRWKKALDIKKPVLKSLLNK